MDWRSFGTFISKPGQSLFSALRWDSVITLLCGQALMYFPLLVSNR